MPALYSDTIRNFTEKPAKELLGVLVSGLAQEGFDTNVQTTFSWQQEIGELHGALTALVNVRPCANEWTVLFEYVLPIIGQRLDCVILAGDVVVVIEYKGGHSATARAALQQAQDYALNLNDFHEQSRGRVVLAIAVGDFKSHVELDPKDFAQGAAVPASQLAATINLAFLNWGNRLPKIEVELWIRSRYFPVPTIIQAASAIFGDHDVREIANSRAGAENLEATQIAVAAAVRDARMRGIKKLVLITGVPGAGKTLAGLNVVQRLSLELDPHTEHASFLSGNGPLVKVLQAALLQNARRQPRGAARSIRSRIREIHRFVRDSYHGTQPPSDRLVVFDEAQRAWTAAKNEKKFGIPLSEPDMLLDVMARHSGWAVVIGLVGGGQEIHAGEAGLAAWGDALAERADWEIITSPEALDGGHSVAGSRLFRGTIPPNLCLVRESDLHLAVPRRSFESEESAAWVNAVLAGQPDAAAVIAAGGLPIWLTRDLTSARAWMRTLARGYRRAGLVASSGAMRLRSEGVEVPSFDFLRGIDYVKWFLAPSGDYRSSNQLEVALSEFEMQGLELDLVGLIWGGDLAFTDETVTPRKLRGLKWVAVSGGGDPQASADDPQIRVNNKYRVLMTRFRKGMVVVIPKGRDDDPTYLTGDFDKVFEYLRRCGLLPLPREGETVDGRSLMHGSE